METMTDRERADRIEGWAYFAAFVACVPLANWMVAEVGTVCVPDGPCLVPLGFGMMVPSGVLMVGLALVLRDLVQRRLGTVWAAVAIAVGAVLSGLVAPPALVLASVAAFAISELVDLGVFTPLQRRGLVRAALLSSLAGLVVDSLVFLWLAFGSLDHLGGQVYGKTLMVLAALPLVWWVRRRDGRRVGPAADPNGAAA